MTSDFRHCMTANVRWQSLPISQTPRLLQLPALKSSTYILVVDSILIINKESIQFKNSLKITLHHKSQ